MINEALVSECWKIACGFYKWKYKGASSKHPYLRDKYWDAVVNAFLIVTRKYDPNKNDSLARYFFVIATREWNKVIRKGNRNKWKMIMNESPYTGGSFRHVV